MTENDKMQQIISSTVAQVLDQMKLDARISPEQHNKHHEFIDMQLEKYRRRRDMADKIKAQIGGWAIIAALGTIGAAAWSQVLDVLHSLRH